MILGNNRRATGFRQLRLIRRRQNDNRMLRLLPRDLNNDQFDRGGQRLWSSENRTDRTVIGIMGIRVWMLIRSRNMLLRSRVNMPMPV